MAKTGFSHDVANIIYSAEFIRVEGSSFARPQTFGTSNIYRCVTDTLFRLVTVYRLTCVIWVILHIWAASWLLIIIIIIIIKIIITLFQEDNIFGISASLINGPQLERKIFMTEKCNHYLGPVKRICVFEHSVMTNSNCACPAIQRGQGSGFLSEGSSWLTACMSEQRRFWRDCADAQARLNLRCSHRR